MLTSWNNDGIVNPMNDTEHKWIKTRINSEELKEMKKLAIDRDVSLAELLRQTIKNLILKKERDNA